MGPLPYLVSRFLIEIPTFFLLYIVALLIPAYAIMDYPFEHFVQGMLLWSVGLHCFEAWAQIISVSFGNPLLGMMAYINVFFVSFLFAGFLISEKDLVWPFKLFYYIMPMKYSVRGTFYQDMIDSKYKACNMTEPPPLCYGQDGKDVLDRVSYILPVYSSEDTFAEDIGLLYVILAVLKALYFVLLIVKTSMPRCCPGRLPFPRLELRP